MWKYALCAVLARGAAAKAAAWALPDPTFAISAIDTWSPAPTEAPGFGAIEFLKRDFTDGGTCGFFSGVSSRHPFVFEIRVTANDRLIASSLTCRRSGDVCATNTYYGNHGCCDPYDISSCTLATTCIPQTLMSASCSDSSCSKNNFIAKCTASANPECYEFDFVYTIGPRTTTMKEWGCTDTALTTEIPLVYSGYSSPGSADTTTSSSSSSSSTPIPSETNTPLQVKQGAGNPNNTPAIIGGVLGGLVIVGALIFAIVYLLLRDRRRKLNAQMHQQQHQDYSTAPSDAPGMVEHNADTGGFIGCNEYGTEVRSATPEHRSPRDWNAWSTVDRDKKGPQDRVTSCAFDGPYGAIETEGRPVHEAPA